LPLKYQEIGYGSCLSVFFNFTQPVVKVKKSFKNAEVTTVGVFSSAEL